MKHHFAQPFLFAILAVAGIVALATQLVPSQWAIVIPNLAYVWLFLQIDRFEKEPWWLLIGLFVWGICSTILGLVGQLLPAWLLNQVLPQLTVTYLNRIVLAPVAEEFFKALPLFYLYYRQSREFDGWVDGIVYGGVIGFGFAIVEQSVFSTTGDSTGAFLFFEEQYYLSTIFFGLTHGIATALAGVGLGVARLSQPGRIKRFAPWLGLLAAIVAHGLFNAGTVIDSEVLDGAIRTMPVFYSLLLIVAVYGVMRAFRFQAHLMQTYLADEISPESYAKLGSGIWDFVTWGKRRRFIQLCGELAQRKQQLPLTDNDPIYQAEIEQLRQKLSQSSVSS